MEGLKTTMINVMSQIMKLVTGMKDISEENILEDTGKSTK